MQFLSRFFTTIQRSLTDVAFYHDLLKGRLRDGVWYLTKLLFVLGTMEILFVAALATPYIPSAETFLRDNLATAEQVFPEGLEVTIDNGKLSTNSAEPVLLPIPDAWADVFASDDAAMTFSSLVVIDPAASAEDYSAKGAVVLFTETSAVFPDSDGGLRVFPLADLDLPPAFVIDNTMVDGLAESVRSMLSSVQPILWSVLAFCVFILPFLLTAFSLLSKMLWLLLPVLLLFAFAKARGLGRTYAEIYRLSLYGLTPVILVSTASSLVNFPLGFWLSLVVFLAFMGYVLTQLPSAKKRKTA